MIEINEDDVLNHSKPKHLTNGLRSSPFLLMCVLLNVHPELGTKLGSRYVCGGSEEQQALNSAERFNPARGVWGQGASWVPQGFYPLLMSK